MTRPITLFTGQWADLPFEEMCRLASEWGYDGLEIAYWGDHLDVWQAAEDDGYVRAKLDTLAEHNLKVWAISNHLKGQAMCDDPIDERHRNILPDRIWGDGDPEGVRQRPIRVVVYARTIVPVATRGIGATDKVVEAQRAGERGLRD